MAGINKSVTNLSNVGFIYQSDAFCWKEKKQCNTMLPVSLKTGQYVILLGLIIFYLPEKRNKICHFSDNNLAQVPQL
jgi:hypothetical protein